MTKRRNCPPAPGPLEAYAQQFDELFTKLNQRASFREYLMGLLLPSKRNKTLTGIANSEPIVGAHKPAVQRLQWFLSESTWDPDSMNRRRMALMRADPLTAPNEDGVLVIDETGDGKSGTKTAHVGRQYLANLGKIDTGVVSVHALWPDEQVYYPLDFEPYTPGHWFPGGKHDQAFRTKPLIALELVTEAVTRGIPFRAVVADSFPRERGTDVYGENETFLSGLTQLEVGYVVALRPSHSWWHALRAIGTIGSVQEVAQAARYAWRGRENAGDWQQITRHFRDGDTETWWALEGKCSAYGPDKSVRLVIATTDPATLPELTTWYLITNLPAPGSSRDQLEAAALSEVVRLYCLRMWVEQSYKQVKQALGWADYQVRQDQAMRRHWQLVCCAFSFCWWAHAHDPMCAHLLSLARTGQPAEVQLQKAATRPTEVGGKNRDA